MKIKIFNFGSFNEMGTYDLPAMIDYILDTTTQKGLNVIGHSQGGANILVMLSEKPEYNEKVKLSILFAPAALLSRAKNPSLAYFASKITAIKVNHPLQPLPE